MLAAFADAAFAVRWQHKLHDLVSGLWCCMLTVKACIKHVKLTPNENKNNATTRTAREAKQTEMSLKQKFLKICKNAENCI